MHCELVPGKLGISICMTKLEELPMDLGLVSPEREREMNPLGAVELVGATLILKMSMELTKTKFKKIGLY